MWSVIFCEFELTSSLLLKLGSSWYSFCSLENLTKKGLEEVYIDLEETPREARSSPIQKITIYEATEDDFEGSGSRASYAIALDDVDFVLWTWYVNFYIIILELLILKYLLESWHKLNVCKFIGKLFT